MITFHQQVLADRICTGGISADKRDHGRYTGAGKTDGTSIGFSDKSSGASVLETINSLIERLWLTKKQV